MDKVSMKKRIYFAMKSKQNITKTEPLLLNTRTFILVIIYVFLSGIHPVAIAQEVAPVLEFPEIGLDDTSTYRGYTTRFFQDSDGNTLQIYIKQEQGRVVNLWADAANESISFSVRDGDGQPASLTWDSPAAKLTTTGKMRYVEYTLVAKKSTLELGHFVLNTMRLERDFQHFKKHLQPFDAEPFIPPELPELMKNLECLPKDVRARHLRLLNAASLDALRSRLVPKIESKSSWQSRVEQTTFDGKNHLSLELNVDSKQAKIEVSQDKISIKSLHGQPIKLSIKIGTDSPSLTPLRSTDIFSSDFFEFYERVKSKRMERQVKGMELLSSHEKLMAGVPNYATYFGRDMMMSVLMLEPVLKPAMLEHVIASVLKKLTATGEVSHEEGLGGQAIRENAAKYNKLMSEYLKQNSQKDEAAKQTLINAEQVLENLQAVTENYHMVDDDFQLPVLTARYLMNSGISKERKREFLQSAISGDDETSKLTLLLRNFQYVSKISYAYGENPVPENLISFKKLDGRRWHAGSWRDSAVGYANGRYAMDINAIWVPQALASIEVIFTSLRELGISIDELQTMAPEIRDTELIEYARKPEILHQAVITWRSAEQHFRVSLTQEEVQQRIRSKLSSLLEEERDYWMTVLAKSDGQKQSLDFLAISLDEDGQPIPLPHTDIATWLFLENLTERIINDEIKSGAVLERLQMFVTPYPIGLFLAGVGPVVANDVYASPDIWQKFENDLYHSPRVIWGREVNLFFLGLAKQIMAAYDSEGQIKEASLAPYVQELRAILEKTLTAVEASGLKHNELWSYRIEGGKLLPVRYATTTDIQLWNLTNLAVQFLLDRLKIK